MFVCPLTQVPVGDKCRIKEITASPELNQRMKEMGFCDDAEIKVLSQEIICEVCQTKFGLCPKLAEKILVNYTGFDSP
jgi:ferrous iron transport protein A